LDTLTAQEQLGGDGYREGQYPGVLFGSTDR